MDKNLVAAELVKVAKDLMAFDEGGQVSGNRAEVLRFIKSNRDTIATDKYHYANTKLMGPNSNTVWMHVSLLDLERIAEILK